MKKDFNEIYKIAAKYFYKDFRLKGGSQKKIAQKLGITQSYVSYVINGSRTGSLTLLEEIAFMLSGKSLDEFLVAGRRIKQDLSPEPKEDTAPEDSPESLIAKLTYYIVDHKRIKEEFENEHWLLQEALNSADYGIVIICSDRKVLAYNKAYKKMIGYPDEILATRDIMTYLKWSRTLIRNLKKFDRQAQEAFKATKRTIHTYSMKDGRTIKRKLFPIYNNENVAGWVVHLIDITSIKRKADRKK